MTIHFSKAPTDYVLNPDLRILRALVGLADHYARDYCKPRQIKILELAKRFTGRIMSRRNLCRHLGALERDGWIERIRRHRRAKDGSLELHSTCYRIKRRSRDALRALNAGWREFLAPFPRARAISAVTKVAQSVVLPIQIVPNMRRKGAPDGWLENCLALIRAR